MDPAVIIGAMDPAVIVAVIALIGAVLSATISLYGQTRAETLSKRRDAETVLAKYREPLVTAAYELQGRLFNIVKLDFVNRYYIHGDESRRTYALENTLYVIAQYFGWSEILRREIQFMSFTDSARTRAVAKHQHVIVELFQSDDVALGQQFLVWRGEQRAIGELMVEYQDGQVRCLGYASFLERRDPSFRRWFERLEADIGDIAHGPHRRLIELQHALVDLVRELDPQRLRYSDAALQKV